MPGAAIALAKRHLGFAKTLRVWDSILDGETAVFDVPMVEDFNLLKAELEACGFDVARHEPPAVVDVRAIREKTGRTQEEFALRYGLDVATVRNWEQGRSSPDMASRTILTLIDRNADLVESLLDA